MLFSVLLRTEYYFKNSYDLTGELDSKVNGYLD
jgi:hypothetical protein